MDYLEIQGEKMEINIIKSSKTEIEFEILDKNPTLPEMLIHYLNQRDDVEFAAYNWEHPMISFPKIVLRTTPDEKASTALLETVEKIRKDISSLKDSIKKVE
jgi:DNA-directed RNA polymerase subunit L